MECPEGIEKLPKAPVWLIKQAPDRQRDKTGSSERAKCMAQVSRNSWSGT